LLFCGRLRATAVEQTQQLPTKQLRPEKKSCWADSNSGESKSHATANRNKKASSYVANKHAERKRNNSPVSFQGGRLLLDADGVFANPHAGSVNEASIDRGGLDVNSQLAAHASRPPLSSSHLSQAILFPCNVWSAPQQVKGSRVPRPVSGHASSSSSGPPQRSCDSGTTLALTIFESCGKDSSRYLFPLA